MIDRLLGDGFLVAGLDGSRHDVASVAIQLEEGETLVRWILREKATRTLEVGFGYGVSALFVCEALLRLGDSAARHVVIDPFQTRRFSDCGHQVLREAGVTGLVEHRAELSQVVLPAFLAAERMFDFAFVDGNHRFDSVFVDLFYLDRLVRRGGIVVLDDYDLPGIERAVSFFVTNLDWRVEETGTAEGRRFVVVRTREGEDTRVYRHFEPF